MPSHPPAAAGRVLVGRYRLERVLGSGAMGTVWSAWDEMVHRSVAIKEINLPPGVPEHEVRTLVDRTLREARAIGALSHPHVITLYDIVVVDERPAIVMELLRSRPLSAVVRELGRLDPDRTAVVGAAVAGALAEAHRAGITHRDVKPGNVLVADDGRVKLTDFGIARAVGDDTVTSTGLLLGSPAYISPEVAGGASATAASDAWGLGALLFACVEGRPPFDRGEPIATLTAVVADPVPPHPHAGALAPVIAGLLVKDPAQRMSVPDALHRLSSAASAAGWPRLDRPSTSARDAATGHRVGGAARTAAEGASPRPADLPPPPWATTDGARASLPPLPVGDAAAPAPSARLRAAVVLVALVVAVLAFLLVRVAFRLGGG